MDNNTLLKIMSLYWQLFIIPNGIEDSLLPLVWPQTLLSRKKKKKKRQNTKNEDTRKIHEMPFDTCFGKSSESEPTWIPVFPSKVGGKPTFATVHNLLPHDSLGFFFFFLKTLNVLLKICIHFSLHNNTKQYNYFCK